MLRGDALIARAVLLFLLALPFIVFGVDFAGTKPFNHAPITTFLLHELPFRGEKFSSEKWLEAKTNCDTDCSCSGLGWVPDTLFVCFDSDKLLAKAGTYQH